MNTKIYILLSYLVCMSSFFPTIASASLLDTLRDQNTAPQQVHHVHAAQQQFRSTPRPSCVAAQNVTIDIFMYHYVRPTHRDPAHTVVWNNSITPTDFSTQMAYLETLTNEHRVHLAHFSELKKRETSGCYPHHRIALLTADDGRWDNYNFLFPITKKHDIKFTLGIIYNKVGIEGIREDPFTLYEEVQEMSDDPLIEIQSHSLSHADLRTLPFQQQAEEICYSKLYLESMFNIDINTFIAPYGGMTEWVGYISDYCGYDYALSTDAGSVSTYELGNTPYRLQRIRVNRGIAPQYIFPY